MMILLLKKLHLLLFLYKVLIQNNSVSIKTIFDKYYIFFLSFEHFQ